MDQSWMLASESTSYCVSYKIWSYWNKEYSLRTTGASAHHTHLRALEVYNHTCGDPNSSWYWPHGQRHVDTYFRVSSAFARKMDARNILGGKIRSKLIFCVWEDSGAQCTSPSTRMLAHETSDHESTGTRGAQRFVRAGTRGGFVLGSRVGTAQSTREPISPATWRADWLAPTDPVGGRVGRQGRRDLDFGCTLDWRHVSEGNPFGSGRQKVGI